MELIVLKDILIIFGLSTLVNYVFTKFRIPTIIGYLITGIIAGPHLTALIQSVHNVELMAEIGVVLLMFTIGMEFSLKHLIRIRKIVFLGGFLQLLVTAFIITFVARSYQLNWSGAVFVGFLTALSSTAVVLKILQERSELTSNFGRTILGILIFQDIILIPLLLFTPLLGGEVSNFAQQFLLLLLKAGGIILFVYVGNKWLMPKLLHSIAMTKNQELFLMSILLVCLSVALLTSELGMSLAFGAFLAGLMISESQYIHNAFGHLIPFKDTFTSFFFVSIGMLLDLSFVVDNYQIVIFTVLLVIVIKMLVASATALVLGHTFRGVIMVGIALSQVGEFSFILAKEGMNYAVISDYYYQLFLAVAIVTMALSPFSISKAKPLAERLMKLPIPPILLEGLFPLKQLEVPDLKNHLVLIGKDSRSQRLSFMIEKMNLPYISIVFDPSIVQEKQQRGQTVIYGDAINEPILHKAHIETAEIVVISIGDLIISMAVIEKVRNLNKHAFILVRTKNIDDIEELYRLGADQVIPEEFETAIDLFERILTKYLVPRSEIDKRIAQVRNDHYGIFRKEDEGDKYSILKEIPNIEINALKVDPNATLIGKNLKEMQFRSTFGVTIVAIKRGDSILENPPSSFIFEADDVAYILGKPEQVAMATELFNRDLILKE
ncbi:MAG: cation:proton antiporter domain-containing protein [Candidatus Cyclobacteriaceae bacterium M3_2C_046]